MRQVDLSAGANSITIRGTAEDTTTQDYTLSVNRGVDTDYGWKAVDDVDTLIAAGNIDPRGIWSDDTTMWVADNADDMLYAYTRSNGNHDSNKDIDLHAGNAEPIGIWSNDTTIWVVDNTDDMLYAYTLSSEARDSDKDIDLHADNTNPTGIWSDGTTVWVVDSADDKLYAYMLSGGVPDSDRDFSALSKAGNADPYGIWSDGATMWVADAVDDKVYSYNMPASGTDATLAGITVDGTAVPDFASDRTSYQYGVESTTIQVTIAATTTDGAADWAVTSPMDADSAPGHQVALSTERNAVTITVTAQDGNTTQDYILSVNRGVAADYGWKAVDDIDNTLIAAGNNDAKGIWSNDTTIWVADHTEDKLYAYILANGARDDGKDIDLHTDNADPTGIWSNDTTMWVAEATNGKLYAYTLSGGNRDDSKNIDLHTDNADPTGIWSNDTTMWVADNIEDKLYAYTLSNGNRDSDKDIDLHADNADPTGIWSDDTTIWVADVVEDKLYAYILSSETRDSGGDFNSLGAAGNADPYGIWSNGATMWVADAVDDKVYSYNMGARRIVAPANLQAELGDSQVTLTWNDPGNSNITGYQYRVSANGGSTWDPNWTPIPGSGTTTSYVVRDLDNGTEYTIEVRAVTSSDEGPESTITAIPQVLPGSPLNLSVAESDQTLTLQWEAPSSRGNPGITAYIVQHKLETAPESAWETANRSGDPTALTHQFSGLDNGLTYQVRVAAVNSEGTGPWATGEGTPNPFHRPPDPPMDIAVATNDRSLTVTWNTPAHDGNGRITGYHVEYRREGETGWKRVMERSATSTIRRQLISGLQNLALYDVRVRAENQYGEGGWAMGSGSTWNRPSQPTNIVVSPENGALLVTWGPPKRDGGLPTSYEVLYNPKGQPEHRVNIDRSRPTSLQERITDLENGQEYYIAVFPYNDLGIGLGISARAVPGVCETGTSPDGYWRVSWLDSPNDSSITTRNYGVGTLRYCMNDELPTDRYLYQRQLCKGNKCHRPEAFFADDLNYYGVDRNFCVPTADECSRRGDLDAALAAIDDLPVDRIGLILNLVYMEFIPGQMNASTYSLQPEDFQMHVVPRFTDRDEYVMFSTAEGGLSGSTRAVRGRDLDRLVD